MDIFSLLYEFSFRILDSSVIEKFSRQFGFNSLRKVFKITEKK